MTAVRFPEANLLNGTTIEQEEFRLLPDGPFPRESGSSHYQPWQRRESNPHRPVSKTDALPIKLLRLSLSASCVS